MKYKWITPEIAQAATLRWVNRLRIAHKLDTFDSLPSGNRGNTQSCVIANAIWDDCQVTGSVLKLGKRTFKLPICAQMFVYHFDTGQMPQLIKRSDQQLKKIDFEKIAQVYDAAISKNEAVELVEKLIGEEVKEYEHASS